ncbi:MAG: hypothetical protein QW035_03555 [Candidatus Anstonellales archaeon]
MPKKKDLVYERLFSSVRDLYMYESEESMPKLPKDIGDFNNIIKRATLLYEK